MRSAYQTGTPASTETERRSEKPMTISGTRIGSTNSVDSQPGSAMRWRFSA